MRRNAQLRRRMRRTISLRNDTREMVVSAVHLEKITRKSKGITMRYRGPLELYSLPVMCRLFSERLLARVWLHVMYRCDLHSDGCAGDDFGVSSGGAVLVLLAHVWMPHITGNHRSIRWCYCYCYCHCHCYCYCYYCCYGLHAYNTQAICRNFIQYRS